MDRRKPNGWWTEDEDTCPVEPRTMTVHETEPDDWSGLFDANGNKLYREKQPFGFRRG